MPISTPQGYPPRVNPIPANANPAMARAVPINQVVPFVLSPAEQQELDTFLIRWERYSTGIKRYDVDFNLFIYNAAIPGADPNKPHKVGFGYFKYIANPRRFVYVVEGEWQGGKPVKRDGDKNPQIFAEKVIIDEKSVSKYDYNSKTVHQINVPPELIGKGIADSPLPLIFGAKADELKRRFSMLVVSQGERIHLYARPLLIEDQQEFKELEILLHTQNLTAQGLKQWGINNKEYNVYELLAPKVNDRLSSVPDDLKQWFATTIDRDWKREVTDCVTPQPATAMRQPPIAQPIQQRNEIPLYRAPQ
jgi:TIGR03009 family protein